MNESCSLIRSARLASKLSYQVPRFIFGTQAGREPSLQAKLVCILIDARLTEPDLYIAADVDGWTFCCALVCSRARPRFYAGCVGGCWCAPLVHIWRARARTHTHTGGLITGRVIRLRCNPSVAARTALAELIPFLSPHCARFAEKKHDARYYSLAKINNLLILCFPPFASEYARFFNFIESGVCGVFFSFFFSRELVYHHAKKKALINIQTIMRRTRLWKKKKLVSHRRYRGYVCNLILYGI